MRLKVQFRAYFIWCGLEKQIDKIMVDTPPMEMFLRNLHAVVKVIITWTYKMSRLEILFEIYTL
jgi:hypothetical protein